MFEFHEFESEAPHCVNLLLFSHAVIEKIKWEVIHLKIFCIYAESLYSIKVK